MDTYRPVDLDQLLELEGESVGNLSQHLALLGIRWSISIQECCASCDPGERVVDVWAWKGFHDYRTSGHAQQRSDLSGEWTCEEWVLQLLELALRQLWHIQDICWPGGERGISPDD